jgi:hypothetical protein
VRFAKKGVNKELRYLSEASTSGSCALPALLSCGPGSFITAKRVKNKDLVGLGKKQASEWPQVERSQVAEGRGIAASWPKELDLGVLSANVHEQQ